ncbi:interleukin-22 receptor subunit alpha-2 [Callorhinchus milii]|uniref:interleukin-22 receptor subunit alpha-2 n=1 Tax=Callorhinchus milii TaxID=7868 RepID=UPI001C3F9CEB|nr:interleukin-22 receptor subunit alpha-2 [Callorhinchus milii]
MAVQQEYTLVWFLLTLVHFNNGQPQVVKFISQNFHSVLHWKPPIKTENSTKYFVEYLRYELKWRKKAECWGINNTFCDLTQETLPIDECYKARVKVDNGEWTYSIQFCPSIHTIISPPEIKLTPREESILVRVNHGLMIPHRTFKGKNRSRILDYKEHPGVQYTITVSIKAHDQILLEVWTTYTTKNKTFEIQSLSPGITYCLSVQTKIEDNISAPSMQQCITLAERHSEAILLVMLCLSIGIVLIFILPLSLYSLYENIYHPQAHLPSVLSGWNSTEKNDVFPPQCIAQTNTDEWEYITDLKVCSNQHEDIQKLESVPIEYSQCHADYQNQGQEILDWEEGDTLSLGQVIGSEHPQYINQVIVDDPFLNNWGLCVQDE